jgi:hypothetical protein
MSKIVRRTRVAAWIARRRLARLLDDAVSASSRNKAGTDRWSDPEWFRFPPF